MLILDGVNEVPETSGPHFPRRNLLSGLADALPEWTKRRFRRPFGLVFILAVAKPAPDVQGLNTSAARSTGGFRRHLLGKYLL